MMSSYNDDNHRFSAPVWGGQNPHSPSTGAWQYAAGRGQHTERVQRGRAVGQGQLYALPQFPNPLGEAAEFVREIERDEELQHRSTLRNAVVGGVLGAGLMYALRRNRGHR
jgi:hypothetical protein